MHVFKSFYVAGRGILFCLRHERHLRFHIVAAAYVMYFATFYEMSMRDYAILALTCTAVISTELINTAIEVVIDKVSPKYNVYAMIGKDIAAGAVLFTAVGAIVVGIFMLWDIDTFIRIFGYFTSDFIKPSLLLLSMIIAVIFIMKAKPRKVGNKRTSGRTN